MNDRKILLDSEGAKNTYFGKKRELTEMATFTKCAKEWMVYATLAICIAMVIVGKVIRCNFFFMFFGKFQHNFYGLCLWNAGPLIKSFR